MPTTIGQHTVATFTSPVNGTSPIDANTVRGNDNTMRAAYNSHDTDPGIHVQSSTLASRPIAGVAGRKWITADAGSYKLWFDDGTRWHEVGGDHIEVEAIADENIVKGDVLEVSGFNAGLNLPRVRKTTSQGPAFAIANETIANGSRGYVINTGLITGINTTTYGTSTEPSILYTATGGTLTATKPASGIYQASAYLLRHQQNNGVLYVEFSAPKIVERSDNTAGTVVLRDGSGNFAGGVITASAFVGPVTGNVETATRLSSARTFALTGNVTGTQTSDLNAGVSIATTIANDTITNAMVNSAAAIAPSKIAGTAVVNDDARLTDARTPLTHGNEAHSATYVDAAGAAAAAPVQSINTQTGAVVLGASDVGADPAGAAAGVQSNLDTHTGATTSVHGIANTADLVLTGDARLSDERTPLNGSVTDAKIVAGGLATSAITGTAVITTDARLSDERVPTDGSVTDAKVSATAGIQPTKIAGTAVVDNDSRLTNERTPVDGSVTDAKIVAGGLAPTSITGTAVVDADARLTNERVPTDGSVTDAKVSATAAIADTKLATISTAGKVSNSATTADSANTASAIVARDASGNFSAGAVTMSSATVTGTTTLNTVAYTWPAADGSNGHVLSTNGSGTLSWTAGGGGGGDVATDNIWTAKGQLAVATGSQTAVAVGVGANGEVLTADSNEASGVKWTAVSGTGTVTSVAAGTGLTGGTITTTGTIAVDFGSTAGTVAAGDDARLSDERTPTDGSVTDAKVSATAAIAYSKLSLTGSIVNADIAAAAGIADTKLATIATAGKVSNSATTATANNTNDAIVARDGSGNFSAGMITASLTGNVTGDVSGNAGTATKLETARTINGVSFDGTQNITVGTPSGARYADILFLMGA